MMGKLKNKIKPSCAAWGETGLIRLGNDWLGKKRCNKNVKLICKECLSHYL